MKDNQDRDRNAMIQKYGFDPFLRPGDNEHDNFMKFLQLLAEGKQDHPFVIECLKEHAQMMEREIEMSTMSVKFPICSTKESGS